MAPQSGHSCEKAKMTAEGLLPPQPRESIPEKRKDVQHIIWFNAISIAIMHLFALYGLLTTPQKLKWQTLLWGLLLGCAGGFGVTGGVHRLWTHRSYKAKWPLRVILLICYSVAGQNTVFDWVRDHRVHHKFSETDADPHNSRRGFFFAHVGWLMQKKHPEVLRRGRQVDMSDVLADPLVAFHHRYFTFFKLFFCFIIPICLPPLCWGDSWYYSAVGMGIVRYVLSLNFTWLVNSAAHIWGNKPYDRRISPTENLLVAFLALGEGWHNYHHVFPWDYKAAELGRYFNFTTLLIDLFCKIGWAYDLKTPSEQLVRRVTQRYGDGTHSVYGNQEISELEETTLEPELPQVSYDD